MTVRPRRPGAAVREHGGETSLGVLTDLLQRALPTLKNSATGSAHAVEEQDERFYGGRLAPWGGAGKRVATAAVRASPALDCVDMAIVADMWV